MNGPFYYLVLKYIIQNKINQISFVNRVSKFTIFPVSFRILYLNWFNFFEFFSTKRQPLILSTDFSQIMVTNEVYIKSNSVSPSDAFLSPKPSCHGRYVERDTGAMWTVLMSSHHPSPLNPKISEI